MADESPADRAARLSAWAPLRTLTDLAHVVGDTWRLANENKITLTEMRSLMADVSTLLNEVAADVNGPLNTSVTELIASEKAALARVAELEGRNAALEAEDASESAAAQAVREAFDGLASKFTQNPDVPDVDPLPPVDGGETPVEPTPGDGGTDVVNPTVDADGNPVV